MKGFSLGRVAAYARYHYIATSRGYYGLMVVMFAIPLIMGVLTRDFTTAVSFSTVLYLFGGIRMMYHTTADMRERSRRVLELTVPISNEERMLFLLFNGVVAYPLMALITAVAAALVVVPFHNGALDLGGVVATFVDDYHLDWALFIFVQCIVAGSLLLNLLARRSLVAPYLITLTAAVLIIALLVHALIGVAEYLGDNYNIHGSIVFDIPDGWEVVISLLMPILLYSLSYIVLRKRQIKW